MIMKTVRGMNSRTHTPNQLECDMPNPKQDSKPSEANSDKLPNVYLKLLQTSHSTPKHHVFEYILKGKNDSASVPRFIKPNSDINKRRYEENHQCAQAALIIEEMVC